MSWADKLPSCDSFGKAWNEDEEICHLCRAERECRELTLNHEKGKEIKIDIKIDINNVTNKEVKEKILLTLKEFQNEIVELNGIKVKLFQRINLNEKEEEK
jgi:hypothetical protein